MAIHIKTIPVAATAWFTLFRRFEEKQRNEENDLQNVMKMDDKRLKNDVKNRKTHVHKKN